MALQQQQQQQQPSVGLWLRWQRPSCSVLCVARSAVGPSVAGASQEMKDSSSLLGLRYFMCLRRAPVYPSHSLQAGVLLFAQ